jgi:hypothetical protein
MNFLNVFDFEIAKLISIYFQNSSQIEFLMPFKSHGDSMISKSSLVLSKFSISFFNVFFNFFSSILYTFKNLSHIPDINQLSISFEAKKILIFHFGQNFFILSVIDFFFTSFLFISVNTTYITLGLFKSVQKF